MTFAVFFLIQSILITKNLHYLTRKLQIFGMKEKHIVAYGRLPSPVLILPYFQEHLE